jgi:hypothetical protein
MRAPSPADDAAREERVHMTRLRQTIARRLKDAQNAAAMLTTFNEVDMSAIMALRTQYKDLFEKKHGVKLGFMGFFVRACIQALKEIPAVNAEIDGTDIIYKNYYHIGVAVGTERGLVVPVVRDADQLSLSGIEKAINDFGRRARDGAHGGRGGETPARIQTQRQLPYPGSLFLPTGLHQATAPCAPVLLRCAVHVRPATERPVLQPRVRRQRSRLFWSYR